MKKARMPVKGGGEWWVLYHDLALRDGRLLRLRPIHLFTFFSRMLVKKGHLDIYRDATALEFKLGGVDFQFHNLAAVIPVAYEGASGNRFVADASLDINVAAALEAYLGAIYSTMQIAAVIAHRLDPAVPRSFRKAVPKVPAFKAHWGDWAARFSDLRSEMTHFAQALPTVPSPEIVIEFRGGRVRDHFAPGRHEISFAEIFSYKTKLYMMLDEWALSHIAGLPRSKRYEVLVQESVTGPPKPIKECVSTVLKLAGIA